MINKCLHPAAAAAAPHAAPSFIKDGMIVPVEVTVSLLSKAIFSSPSWNFLVDGFPRNMDNFNGWFDAIGDECDVRATMPRRTELRPPHRPPAGTVRALLHVSPKRHGAAVEAQVSSPPPSTCSSTAAASALPLSAIAVAESHVTLAGVQVGE
jgi:hypothetical protein